MNVYDFDGTIYRGDSTIEFYLYCLVRRPFIARYWPGQFRAMWRYKTGRCDKTKMKEDFFSFLRGIKDIGREVESFWKYHKRKLDSWYIQVKKPTDVIISASPEFLLRPICRELGIKNLIASQVDGASGIFAGDNCYGEEKVRRFQNIWKDEKIDAFYSDSESDLPMAKLAVKAYMKKKGKFTLWKFAEK